MISTDRQGRKHVTSHRRAILHHNSLETEVTHNTSVGTGYSQLKLKPGPVECEKYTLKFWRFIKSADSIP